MQSIRHSLRDEVCEREYEYILCENERAGKLASFMKPDFHSGFIIDLHSAEAHL